MTDNPQLKTEQSNSLLEEDCVGWAYLLRVTVEEEVRHDLPGQVSTDAATKTKNFTAEEPPHQPQRVLTLHQKTEMCTGIAIHILCVYEHMPIYE